MRSLRRTAVAAVVAVACALLVTGCTDDSVDTHGDADVSFAQEMVPHHEQAKRMVDMTEGRTLSPDFEDLTQHIEDAQEPEIATMTGWLEDWGEDVPTGFGQSGMMSGSTGMAGMMSDDDLDELDGADRSTFESMWLRMMIAHHEGAVEMAKAEIATGTYRPALDLATSIVESQTREIAEMRQMLH
jgi:uncharacterized protein (DUF305 family)